MTYLAWYREIVLKLPRQNLLCVVWRKDIELQSSSSSISPTQLYWKVFYSAVYWQKGYYDDRVEYTVCWNCLWKYVCLFLVREKFAWGKFVSRKVASRSTLWLVAHPRIFRLFMKGKVDPYLLWPLIKRVQNWIVDRSTACNFMVSKVKHP